MDYVYDLDFYDFLIFHRKIRTRDESKAIAELRRIQLLTTAIHAADPNEFISSIEDSLNDEPSKEIVGDLSELEKLKHQRMGHGMGVV